MDVFIQILRIPLCIFRPELNLKFLGLLKHFWKKLEGLIERINTPMSGQGPVCGFRYMNLRVKEEENSP